MEDIVWRYYPPHEIPNATLQKVIEVFREKYESIRSDKYRLKSNEVLHELRPALTAEGFRVESGKGDSEKVKIPVLFGPNGETKKCFDADAYRRDLGIVLEVEAGRAVSNYQFLKDVFEACVMEGINYLAIGVRKTYSAGKIVQKDFETVTSKFLSVLYASPRLKLPLQGILVVGY